jgi:hypothetical protein
MYQLKKLSSAGIPRALKKVERYRLLNEPAEAESICRDILSVDRDHQEALIMLILSLSDQFGIGVGHTEACEAIQKIKDEYKRAYYTGIIKERLAKATLKLGGFSSNFDAYEWLVEAMAAFEEAAPLSSSGNEDAILRYNACVRTIHRQKLTPRQQENREQFLE